MNYKTIALFLLLPLKATAQDRYCTGFEQYKAGEWHSVGESVTLKPSSRQDMLAFTVRASDKKMSHVLRRRTFALLHDDSLYISLRPFNRFGDVYVRAWKLPDGNLIFARQEISSSSRFGIVNGDTGQPLSSRSFRSLNSMENLVCYIVTWDERRVEMRLARLMPDGVMSLLKNHPEQLARYQALSSSRRMSADVIIDVLREAGQLR